MKKIIALFAMGFLSSSLIAQTLSIGSFNSPVLEENFSDQPTLFPLSTTSENYFIVDNGDFFLSRNHQEKEYSVFARQPLTLTSYRIKTALKLGPSSGKKAHIGVLFNTQINGKGAVAIELNTNKQYRVRQIDNGKPKHISGNRKDAGWVYSDALYEAEFNNYVDIVCHQGSFDIYINHQYISSYTVPDYQSGGLGFIIGANTKARVDFIHVYKQGEAVSYEEFTSANNKVLELEESLRRLKEEKNGLETSNKSLNEEVSSAKSKISELEGNLEGMKIQTATAQEKINQLNQTNSSLKKNKTSLQGSIQELEKQNTELVRNTAQKSTSIEQLNEKLTKLSAEKNTLSQELKNINNNLIASKNKIVQLETKVEKQLNTVNNLNEQLKNLNTLKKDLQAKNSEVVSQKARIQQLESNYSNKSNNLETTKKELAEKQKIISSLSRKNTLYSDSLNSLQNSDKELSSTKKILTNTKNSLTQTQSFLSDKLKEIEMLNSQLNEQKQIAAQFAESYRLEVQKNRQLQKEITFNQSEVSVSNSTKSNTIYRVQIGTFNEEMEFDGISDITSIPTQDGKYIYMSGKFDSYSEAKVRLMQVAELGYKEAYIVKF